MDIPRRKRNDWLSAALGILAAIVAIIGVGVGLKKVIEPNPEIAPKSALIPMKEVARRQYDSRVYSFIYKGQEFLVYESTIIQIQK